MPQDAFAAFANGFNAAIASGFNFASTSRSAEPQAQVPPPPGSYRRATTKSAPAAPKRPVLSYFEDMHERCSGIRPKEAGAIRYELALVPDINVDAPTYKHRRSSKATDDTGVLSAAEEGESDYDFSDADARRSVSRYVFESISLGGLQYSHPISRRRLHRSRKTLRSRLTGLNRCEYIRFLLVHVSLTYSRFVSVRTKWTLESELEEMRRCVETRRRSTSSIIETHRHRDKAAARVGGKLCAITPVSGLLWASASSKTFLQAAAESEGRNARAKAVRRCRRRSCSLTSLTLCRKQRELEDQNVALQR